MNITDWLLLIAVVGVLLYYLGTRNFNYWKNRGINYIQPTFLLGNIGDVMLQKKSMGYFIKDTYNQFIGEKVVGLFAFSRPGLIIKDGELIHKILVTDFHSFRNNDQLITEENDPILGRNIFFQKDEKWKKYRAILTPAFTAGKVKHIFPQMQHVAGQLTKFIEERNGVQLQLKELISRYTSEIVAQCGLGIEGKNFDSENPKMHEVGQIIFAPNFWSAIKFLLVTMMPWIMNIFKIKLVTPVVYNYFNSILQDVIVYRQKHDETKRNDLLDFLIEVKRKSIEVEKGNIKSSIITKTYTDQDILSGCIMFFLEGYETSSVALSFMIHTLATRPDIQEALREEIQATLKANNNELNFETVSNMPYINSFVLESHRLYPVVFSMAKICTEDYVINLNNEKNLLVKKGTSIVIPVVGLHHDPDYWKDPDVFRPERFANNEDAVARSKGYYFPFGDGPRMCIGVRLASTIIKVALIHLVKNFNILPSEMTPQKIEYDPKGFMMSHKGGLYAKFVKRQN